MVRSPKDDLTKVGSRNPELQVLAGQAVTLFRRNFTVIGEKRYPDLKARGIRTVRETVKIGDGQATDFDSAALYLSVLASLMSAGASKVEEMCGAQVRGVLRALGTRALIEDYVNLILLLHLPPAETEHHFFCYVLDAHGHFVENRRRVLGAWGEPGKQKDADAIKDQYRIIRAVKNLKRAKCRGITGWKYGTKSAAIEKAASLSTEEGSSPFLDLIWKLSTERVHDTQITQCAHLGPTKVAFEAVDASLPHFPFAVGIFMFMLREYDGFYEGAFAAEIADLESKAWAHISGVKGVPK